MNKGVMNAEYYALNNVPIWDNKCKFYCKYCLQSLYDIKNNLYNNK